MESLGPDVLVLDDPTPLGGFAAQVVGEFRLRAQDRLHAAFEDGVFGVLLEAEYCSRESEGDGSKYKPHKEVVEILLAGLVPLRAQFPGVLFAVPEETHIIHERPAAWAYVADGLLDKERMESLGVAMLNL